ncbi:hypothetical protein [Helicobacter sp. T3_23-1059]
MAKSTGKNCFVICKRKQKLKRYLPYLASENKAKYPIQNLNSTIKPSLQVGFCQNPRENDD